MAEHFEKGVTPSEAALDGSKLRICIVHTRWNYPIVEALVEGAKTTMIKKYNVAPENIVVHAVPGAYELPFAAQQAIRLSKTNSAVVENDLFATSPTAGEATTKAARPPTPRAFDAVIPIGVLIKGSTMHFEYICDAVSNGLMRVGLDTEVPVVFGVLTCLTDEQALERAGLGRGEKKGHNHGEDWGAAAVEMALIKERKF